MGFWQFISFAGSVLFAIVLIACPGDFGRHKSPIRIVGVLLLAAAIFRLLKGILNQLF